MLLGCHTDITTTHSLHWAVDLARFLLAAGGGERSDPNMLQSFLFTFLLGLRVGWEGTSATPECDRNHYTCYRSLREPTMPVCNGFCLTAMHLIFTYHLQFRCIFLLNMRIQIFTENPHLQLDMNSACFRLHSPYTVTLYTDDVQRCVLQHFFGWCSLQLFHSPSIPSLQNRIGLRGVGGTRPFLKNSRISCNLQWKMRTAKLFTDRQLQLSLISEHSFGITSSVPTIDILCGILMFCLNCFRKYTWISPSPQYDISLFEITSTELSFWP